MSSSESDEDEFMLARYGTPMEELDDPEVAKKPIAVHEQIVTDDQGRRRFHGAFTGGFSAGYYNTVDTEEGWTPTSFRSSRSVRKNNKIAVPEDFMDDEDMSEYGIAPQKIVTQAQFSTKNKENDRSLLNKGKFQKNATMLLGIDMMQSLVVTVSNNIGTKLLQKMGWKPGQGIGPKVKKPKKANFFIPENVEFAPEDCIPMEFLAKDNVFGLGYTGMDPKKALHDKVKKSSEIAIRTKSGAKLSFIGQAFGVGAYEEEDQDIYAQDSMANYDLEMSEEKNDGTYGWSKPTKAITGTDARLAIESAPKMLQNFQKAEKSIRRKMYPPPLLPPDYDPFKRSKVMQKYGSFGAKNVMELTPEEERERQFQRLDPNDRGKLLGETLKIETAEKKFDQNDSVFALLKPTDRQRLQILKHGGIGQPLPPEKPKKSGFYAPFASNPQKQERYELYLKFLKMREPEPYLKIERDPNMTEWEMQQEREEFMKSSRFFQPLSATMSSRFAAESEAFKKEDEKEKSQKEAVKLKMFGILTRDTFEWHPDSLLCKRFNVPNPYPNSDITGIPGEDSGKLEMFLHPDDIKPKLQIPGQNTENNMIKIGSKATGIIKDTKNPPLFEQRQEKSVSRWDEMPREQLALPKPQHSTEKTVADKYFKNKVSNESISTATIGETCGHVKMSTVEDTPPSGAERSRSEIDAGNECCREEMNVEKSDYESDSSGDESDIDKKPERPPMDIFRAIFASSDSDSSDSDGDEIMTRSSKNSKFKSDQNETTTSKKESDINQPNFHKFSVPKKRLENKGSMTSNSADQKDIVTEQSPNENCKISNSRQSNLSHDTNNLSQNVEDTAGNNIVSATQPPQNAGSDQSSLFKASPSTQLPRNVESQLSLSKIADSANAPLFHKFLSKHDRAQKRPNVGDQTENALTFGPPQPSTDTFGPALPPLKIPKTIEFVEKKPKKLKHKKKHKKNKKNKK